MNLEECLKEYRALTLDIMERTNTDGSIGHLIEEREKVLNMIKKLGCSQNTIKEISNSLNLIEIEKELTLLVKKEKINTRKKIENLKRMREANMQYTALGYVPSMFNRES